MKEKAKIYILLTLFGLEGNREDRVRGTISSVRSVSCSFLALVSKDTGGIHPTVEVLTSYFINEFFYFS